MAPVIGSGGDCAQTEVSNTVTRSRKRGVHACYDVLVKLQTRRVCSPNLCKQWALALNGDSTRCQTIAEDHNSPWPLCSNKGSNETTPTPT